MAFVSSIERMGIEFGMQQGMRQGIQQGMQQGIQQGESLMLLEQVQHKFKTIPEKYRQRIKTDAKTLKEWAIKLLDCQSLEEIFQS